jgi:TRAP-type C4-dicarboxylate transport system permease small subunit
MLKGSVGMKQKMIIEEKIIATALCFMVVLVTAQVLSRYIAHKSLSFTEEIVRYAFVWITFLGISAAAFRGRHLSISGTLHVVPSAFKKYLKYVRGTAAVIFAGMLIFFGANVTILQIKTGQTTAALGLPMWIIGLAIPLCSLIFVFRLALLTFGKGNRD